VTLFSPAAGGYDQAQPADPPVEAKYEIHCIGAHAPCRPSIGRSNQE